MEWNKRTMAFRIQSSFNPGWSTLVLLSIYCYSVAVKASVPVSSIENGFLPSRIWVQDSLNNSTEMLKEESKKYDQWNVNYNHQTHQPASPQLLSAQTSWSQQVYPAHYWAPSSQPVPSTSPPPLPPLLVNVTIPQTGAFVIICQVQEPLEHISWIWFPCPNNISPSDGIVIASGTIVFNTTLYSVRILGQLGFYISELTILQNPLQSGTAGLYRCDAWPHGQAESTESLYHDDFIIGGQDMVNTCFSNSIPTNNGNNRYYQRQYIPAAYRHKTKKSFRSPRNNTLLDLEDNNITDL